MKSNEKGGEKNEKERITLSNLLDHPRCLGVPMVHGEELTSTEIREVSADEAGYCHMTFSAHAR